MSDRTPKFFAAVGLPLFFVSVGLFSLAPGCGPSECRSCGVEGNPYTCYVTGTTKMAGPPFSASVCKTNGSDANTWCVANFGEGHEAVGEHCYYGADSVGDDGDDEASEWPSGWPGSEIVYDSGIYYVTDELRDALHSDLSFLYADSAHFVASSTGGFYLASVTSGDLWDELGFASGDLFLTLNGNNLVTAQDVFDAYDAVWQDTTFAIVYRRGGNPYTMYIVVQ
jgi:hypothetical protein